MKLLPVGTSLALACLATLSTGCASIMSGPNQTVAVKSKPDGAKATFYDKKGVAIATWNTPMIVKLKRRHNYVLKVEKEQFAPFETPVKGGLNGWYFGNVIFGGLVGILIVDPATGAMWSLSPDDVVVDMAPTDSGRQSLLLTKANTPVTQTPKAAAK